MKIARIVLSSMFVLSVLGSAPVSAHRFPQPYWDAVYQSTPNAWMIRHSEMGMMYLWGFSYGEQQTEDIVDSLNFTNGCQGGCQPTTTGCYAVEVADFETWRVTKGSAWIFEANIQTDAEITRDSLAITHPC